MKIPQIVDRFQKLEKEAKIHEGQLRVAEQYFQMLSERITQLEETMKGYIRKYKFYIDLEQKILRRPLVRWFLGFTKKDIILIFKLREEAMNKDNKKVPSPEMEQKAIRQISETEKKNLLNLFGCSVQPLVSIKEAPVKIPPMSPETKVLLEGK